MRSAGSLGHKTRLWRRLRPALLTSILCISGLPASAQFFSNGPVVQRSFLDDGFGSRASRSPHAPRQGNWDAFDPAPMTISPIERRFPVRRPAPRHYAQVDFSHAPAAKDTATKHEQNVLVLGDAMADWLSFGLEEISGEQPSFGIIRRPKSASGLIKYSSERNSAPDWPSAAKDILATEKPDAIVVMLGLNDRHALIDHDVAYEFRDEAWAKAYAAKIQQLIAALKVRGAPIIWVGLPAVEGTQPTSDILYLDALFRDNAAKAGIVYVDIWDGFVDDAGRYHQYGPDYQGQMRQLRSADGVYFTKYGATKLAHYVQREIARLLPTATAALAPEIPHAAETGRGSTKAQTRPLAGAVIPLVAPSARSDVLLGGSTQAPALNDELAIRTLVRGKALTAKAGRADDFSWPRSNLDPMDMATAKPPAQNNGTVERRAGLADRD